MTDTDRPRSADAAVCALCGAPDVQVYIEFTEDGESVERGLCDLHAAKLERWWKRESEFVGEQSATVAEESQPDTRSETHTD